MFDHDLRERVCTNHLPQFAANDRKKTFHLNVRERSFIKIK